MIRVLGACSSEKDSPVSHPVRATVPKCARLRFRLRNPMKMKSITSTFFASLMLFGPAALAQGPTTKANDDTFLTTIARGPVVISNLLENDTDPENDPLTIINVSQPQFGKIEIRRNGPVSVVYTPGRQFRGSDSFVYRINDRPNGLGNSSTATVTIRNPFLLGRGTYATPISGEGGGHDVSGYMNANVTGTGDFTCVFRFAGSSYRFKGRFDVNGNFSGQITRPGLPSLQLALQFATSGKNQEINGTVSFGAESVQFLAPLVAWSRSIPAPALGRFTFVLPPPNSAPTTPQGNGFAASKVGRNGSISTIGRTGDNRSFTSSTFLRPNGRTLPLYGIVRSVGTIQGELGSTGTVTRAVGPDSLTGSLRWFAVRNPRRQEFPNGFDVTVISRGSKYFEPRAGGSVLFVPAIPTSNGSFTAKSGTLLAPRTERATLGNRPIAGPYAVSFDDSKRLGAKLTITPRSGLFTGSFYDTRSRLTFRMSGVFVQGENKALGLFKTPRKTGQVELLPDALQD